MSPRRSPSPPHLLIIGAYGMTNLGDDAILAAMLTELRAALPGAQFSIVGQDLASLPHAADITPIPFTEQAIRTAVPTADLLIIGGGGLLFDFRNRMTYADFFGDRASNFYPHYRAAVIAHGLGIPVQLYAVGVGPLVGSVARGLTRTICSLASAISVRDTLSALELRGLGVVTERIVITADPAVRLPALQVTIPPHSVGGPRVGFVIRNWFPITHDAEEHVVPTATREAYLAQYLDLFAAAADHVVERWDGQPLFFAVQQRVDDDQVLVTQVLARMRQSARAEVVAFAPGYRDLQAVLSGVDLVVSTRLHGLILAAVEGVPGIGLNLNTKVRALLCDLGLPDLAYSPWNGRTAALTAQIDRVLAAPDEFRTRLRVGMAAQRRAATQNPAQSVALLAQLDR